MYLPQSPTSASDMRKHIETCSQIACLSQHNLRCFRLSTHNPFAGDIRITGALSFTDDTEGCTRTGMVYGMSKPPLLGQYFKYDTCFAFCRGFSSLVISDPDSGD